MSTSLGDRLDPARERVTEAGDRLRERVEPAVEVALSRAGEAREVARHRAEEARERATEVAKELEPTRRRVAEKAGPTLRTLVGFLAVIPSLLARLFSLASSLSDTLAEQGREVAARVEPPKHVKRSNRLRTAGWAAGGFAAGLATGWVIHSRTHEHPQQPEYDFGASSVPGATAGTATSPYGEDAEAIDARRERADLG